MRFRSHEWARQKWLVCFLVILGSDCDSARERSYSQPTAFSTMTCHDLAERISGLRPDLFPGDVARLTLMILARNNDDVILSDDDALYAEWRHASFRLEAASDQHAAVAVELERLYEDNRVEFSEEQLWILLRAVKVQSQLLEIYTEQTQLV